MFLADFGMGFTGLALGSMLAHDGVIRAGSPSSSPVPEGTMDTPNDPQKRTGKAKSVIWVFLSGGYSHLETFDPKPALNDYAGKTYQETPFPNPVNSQLHKKRFRSVPAEEINVRDVYPTI